MKTTRDVIRVDSYLPRRGTQDYLIRVSQPAVVQGAVSKVFSVRAYNVADAQDYATTTARQFGMQLMGYETEVVSTFNPTAPNTGEHA